MPRGKGRPFEKGNRANPLGAAVVPSHMRKFKAKTYDDFIKSLEKMGDTTQEELIALVGNKKSKNMPIIFGRFILECQRGNMVAMKLLFEYLWGKPKELDPNLGGLTNVTPQVVISLPSNGRDEKTNKTIEI